MLTAHSVAPSQKLSVVGEVQEKPFCVAVCERFGECGFGGAYFFSSRNAMPTIRKGAVIAFGTALVIVQIGDTYVPRTALTDTATVTGVWVFYTLFVLIAFAVEKIGVRTKSNTP